MPTSNQPIGVFDSGIGGLSVLQALRILLPNERWVYIADSAYAPYGEKTDAEVQRRAQTLAEHLNTRHHIKALVVACNTATAAAIHSLREASPERVIVGLEPALKPALLSSRTRRIGVMATRGTTQSRKFSNLLDSVKTQADFAVCACDGLAYAIEQSTHAAHLQTAQSQIKALLSRYLETLGPWGQQAGERDTLVLGCTHYVFAHDAIRDVVGDSVQIIHTGDAVAQHTRRRLTDNGLCSLTPIDASSPDALSLWTTGELDGLQAAAQRWLNVPAQHCHALKLG